MARDRANIRLDMWADQDWRDLSEGAQHLYMLLMSHPTLSYAGVADWKPGRLAAMTCGKTSAEIVADAAQLRERFFIVVDADSEEVLVRSFIKHDGLMKQPKLVVSMTNAYAAVASRSIREVIAFEVQKLHDRHPELNAWGVKQVQTLLAAKGTDIHTLTPDPTPAFTPKGEQAQGLPTSTTTSTTTSTDVDKRDTAKRGARLSPDWMPTPGSVAKAKTDAPHVDCQAEHATFVDYWIAQPGAKGVKLDWDATWRNWMRRKEGDWKSKPGGKLTPTQRAQQTVALATELLAVES